LQISKASASTNARQLRDQGVLKLTSKPGERQDFYELMPNPFQGVLEKMSEMMAQAASGLGECLPGLATSKPGVQQRAASLHQFYLHSAHYMAQIAQQLTPIDQGPQTTATANGQESDHD
jgi:DNA-binding transcriptional regulator GbsR (MarR family)